MVYGSIMVLSLKFMVVFQILSLYFRTEVICVFEVLVFLDNIDQSGLWINDLFFFHIQSIRVSDLSGVGLSNNH